MLIEGEAVSGFECILLRIFSGKLQIYESVFYLQPVEEEIIGDRQCGFRRIGSVTDHIFWICQILEKKYNEAVHRIQGSLCFS